MKNKYSKVFFLLLLVSLVLSGCSGEQTKEFDSYAPDEEANILEAFDIDSTNTIKINKTNIVEDNNNQVLIVDYEWENGGNDTSTTFDNFTMTASQDGVALEPTLEPVSDYTKLVASVDSGETLEGIEQGFILDSDKPVTLSILGSDPYFLVDNEPMNAFPVKVEITLNQ